MVRFVVRDQGRGIPADKIDKIFERFAQVEASDKHEKGGAGLGIIDLARKSGNKLNYEFNKVSNEYSFFCLTITFPYSESK